MNPLKFTKKPVDIEAFELHPNDDQTRRLPPPWLVSAILSGKVKCLADGGANIETLEGVMHASVGDWIIQGVRGELYPCKPDIFAETYERENGAAHELKEAPPSVPTELDVRKILLEIVPGDGDGYEVYAKSVDDVVDKLTELDEKLEVALTELGEWRKLKMPEVMHANLLRGVPCRLEPEQLRHLLGVDKAQPNWAQG